MNLVYALGVAAMPIYLYLSPMFGLTLEEVCGEHAATTHTPHRLTWFHFVVTQHAVHMAVVTVVTAVLLSMAYGKVAQKEVIRLSKKADSRCVVRWLGECLTCWSLPHLSRSHIPCGDVRACLLCCVGRLSPAKKGSKGSDDAAAAAIVKQASSYSYFRNNALFLVRASWC